MSIKTAATHSKRLDWFLKAYSKVQQHPGRKKDDLDYCLYLESQCRTLKQLKQKMYRSFPYLKVEVILEELLEIADEIEGEQ